MPHLKLSPQLEAIISEAAGVRHSVPERGAGRAAGGTSQARASIMLDVEDYEMLGEVEAILKKPAPYVGEVEPVEYDDMLPDPRALVAEGKLEMARRRVRVSQALLKIIGELLDNASDHAKRDTIMNRIWISIARDGTIGVKNNGTGITTKVHPKHQMPVVEMIFGHLHTGSNFGEDRGTLQGQNGLGGKLALLFSTRGTVRVVSQETRECWTQRTGLGLSDPRRTMKPAPKAEGGSVAVTILPDYPRFGVDTEEEMREAKMAILRMAVDLAATVREGVRVVLEIEKPDGEWAKPELTKLARPFMPSPRVTSKYFAAMFPGGARMWVHQSRGWNIAIALLDDEQDRPKTLTHASFVNGCRTVEGGSHLDAVQSETRKALMLALGGKNDGVSMNELCSRLFFGIDAEVRNPRFTSQCKTYLSSARKELPALSLSAADGKAILGRLDGLKELVSTLRARSDQRTAARADGKKSRVVMNKNLKDANLAGGARSRECTLIVGEGDSANKLALAGISAAPGGNDLFGTFKLKGKPINTMKLTKVEAVKNEVRR